MDGLGLIISLICGAVGGIIAGHLLKNFSLGTLLNSIVGIVGGGLGATLLGLSSITAGADPPTATFDIGVLIGNIASSIVGGGILMVIIGMLKNLVAGSAS